MILGHFDVMTKTQDYCENMQKLKNKKSAIRHVKIIIIMILKIFSET